MAEAFRKDQAVFHTGQYLFARHQTLLAPTRISDSAAGHSDDRGLPNELCQNLSTSASENGRYDDGRAENRLVGTAMTRV